MRKILQVSFSELPTLQKHLYAVSKEMRRRGEEVWTVGSCRTKTDVELASNNILVETPASPMPNLTSLRQAFSQINSIASMLHCAKPDIVHFMNKHTWNYLLIRKLRKVFPRTVFLHSFHDPIGHAGDSVQRAVVMYHKMIQKKLDGVIVFSDVAYRQTMESLKPKCPVFQVPFGEKPWFDYAPPEEKVHKLLFFGRLNAYKGIEHLEKIASGLLVRLPEVKIVVAGQPSSDVDPNLLRSLAAMPNVDMHSRFIEESEIDDFFWDCSLVLVPYTSITQSGVILDAYSRSRGVLAFDIDGMRQFVPDEKALVAPFEIDQYVNRICWLLENEFALNAFSRKAWEFGRDNCTVESMVDGMLAAYARVLDDLEVSQ